MPKMRKHECKCTGCTHCFKPISYTYMVAVYRLVVDSFKAYRLVDFWFINVNTKVIHKT